MNGHVGISRLDVGVGSVVAALVHVGLGVGLYLAPAGESGAPKAEVDPDVQNCSAVVTTACIGLAPQQVTVELRKPEKKPGDRRCPEPVRRLLRRELEPPPPVAVDLLQAELVAALGVETGKLIAKPEPAKVEAPKPKLVEAIGENKLGEMLDKKETGAAEKQKKLGDILGRPDGKEGGEGKVNMPGSAYVREVKVAVTRSFVLPATVPPWEAAELVAKVRITRMTATGGILEWRFDKQSGNDAFDGAVRALMAGYKSGTRSLPEPPPHILEEINSRGFTIELRGGRGG